METWHLPINCQIVAEYMSEYLNFQNFPGGYVPGPYPTLGMDPFYRSLNKFLCHCISKCSSSVTYNENDTLIRDCVTIIRRGWGLKNEPHIEKYFKFSSDPPPHFPLARHPPNFLWRRHFLSLFIASYDGATPSCEHGSALAVLIRNVKMSCDQICDEETGIELL